MPDNHIKEMLRRQLHGFLRTIKIHCNASQNQNILFDSDLLLSSPFGNSFSFRKSEPYSVASSTQAPTKRMEGKSQAWKNAYSFLTCRETAACELASRDLQSWTFPAPLAIATHETQPSRSGEGSTARNTL